MNLRRIIILFCIIVFILLAPACKKEKKDDSSTRTEELILSTFGPNKEVPVSSEIVSLTDAQVDELKGKGLKLAVVFHDTNSDFSKALIAGVEKACSDYNIEVVTVTDAGFDAAKQSQDIADALALEPDIIVSIIIDSDGAAAAFRPAVESGVKIALLSNLPTGFVHGKDYAGIVTDDLFSMGKYVAEMMGEALNNRGKVVLMYHDASYYVTNQRDQAVKTVLGLSYPDIEILATVGIANPADAKQIAAEVIKDYPDVQAIYAPWDTIAEGVVEACEEAGKEELMVFTMDLGVKNAINMVQGKNITGVVADLPFEMGHALTRLSALAVLGEETPSFIIVPSIKVDRDNIEQRWKEALNAELPVEIKDIM